MSHHRILIVGSGGREHALAWKVAQSPLVSEIFVAPGNAGTSWPAAAAMAPASNVDIPVSDLMGLAHFARDTHIYLTIVGPEVPLADGIVDLFHKEGLRIFGPTQAAAQLEASKAFSKEFMREVGIPTAGFATFTEAAVALDYLSHLPVGTQVVVKASGLAAGKGVIVCDDRAQAATAVRDIMAERAFGEAGDEIIIEERLSGLELSVLALSDGKTIKPLAAARDHKRAFTGDLGPNTGGMGAIAPVNKIDAAFMDEITRSVLQPTVDGMAARGVPYLGVLYAGLMLTPDGPKVLEFNCRFGDPETQVVLPLLENDLVEVLIACLQGQLDGLALQQKAGACATVVMASAGYPAAYPTGKLISGLERPLDDPQIIIFQAGTEQAEQGIVTSGGRVLAVSGLGASRQDALDKAYAGVEHIKFEGAHFRTDIGQFS